MKGYKRLTKEHINDAEFCSGCSFDDDLNGCEIGGCDKYYMYFETYEKLRKLEDKIENGELGDVKEAEHRAKAAEDELARHKRALIIAGDKFINEVCNMRGEDISDKCDYKCDTCFYDYYLQQAEKELAEEKKDDSPRT